VEVSVEKGSGLAFKFEGCVLPVASTGVARRHGMGLYQ